MPIYKIGDMWKAFDEADLFCITTNSVLNRDYTLVMGKGIAGQAAKKYPTLPERAGKLIWKSCDEKDANRHAYFMGKYGFLPLFSDWDVDPWAYVNGVPKKLALLQTKYDWRKSSPPDLVAHSIHMLHLCADRNPNKSIHLPFPGIGNGGLNPFDIKPLLDILPDNVTVWRDR